MTFLDFINTKKNNDINEQSFLEGFKTSDIAKANELILALFKKKLDGTTVAWSEPFDILSNGKKMLSYRFMNVQFNNENTNIDNLAVWSFNYIKSGDSNEVYSIDLYHDKDAENLLWNKTTKTTLTIDTLGTSVAYFIPIICQIVSSGNYKISKTDATNAGNTIFKGETNESKYTIGAFDYTVLEGLTESSIENVFFLSQGYVNEASDLQNARWVKKSERDAAYKQRNDSPEAKAKWEKLRDEYQEIVNAIKGGATTLNDVKFSIKSSVKTEEDITGDVKDAEKEVEKEKEDPEVAFKKMGIYIKAVLNNMQPGTIICGAPGIGKTFRVLAYLKQAGYKDYDETGSNSGKTFITIKGTCSPRQLYMTLYNFNKPSNIIVVDDADAVIGPKAPEVSLNCIKAALDSTSSDKGRLITYLVSGDLKDDEGNIVPKRCHTQAGMIVLTNYSVGQLNTAVRGRVYTQTLDFTTKQMLDLIKKLFNKLDSRITVQNKQKAYDYLVKLDKEKVNMAISIRSFLTCARLYQLTEGEGLTEEQVENMIKEQMQNQAIQGGKSF